MNQIIRDAYIDPKRGFVSAATLFNRLRGAHPTLKLEDVKDVLDRIDRKQQFQPIPKPKFDTISASKPRDAYQIDLADFSQLKRQNDNSSFIFVCIDVHSRYALWLPCKTKSIRDVRACLKAVFATMGHPKNITTDFESSILSNEVQDWLTSLGISHWAVTGVYKRNNAMAERNIRTLREMLTKMMATLGTRRYIGPLLAAANENYNSKIHRMIKATPHNVFNGVDKSQQIPIHQLHSIPIGAKVRVSKIDGFKDPLAKQSALKKWTKSIYTVIGFERRRYICKSDDTDAITKRMGYELQVIPSDTVTLYPSKNSVYTAKPQSGKAARAERTALQNEAALRRDEIDTANVQPSTRSAQRQPDDQSRFGIDKLLAKRKRNGHIEYRVKWYGYTEPTWEPRTFLSNPRKSKLSRHAFTELEREYNANN